MDARSITLILYPLHILIHSLLFLILFISFNFLLFFFLCPLYFVSIVEFLNIMNDIWTWYSGLWRETKISLKVNTFSQLVVVSNIHNYTNSIESCFKHIWNIYFTIKLGDFGLFVWLGTSLKILHLSFKFINSSNIL